MQNSNLHAHQTQNDHMKSCEKVFCSVQIIKHNHTSISIFHSSWHIKERYQVRKYYDRANRKCSLKARESEKSQKEEEEAKFHYRRESKCQHQPL